MARRSLWPRAERGRRLPVTFEAVETLLAKTIEVLGLRSATGLAMSCRVLSRYGIQVGGGHHRVHQAEPRLLG